MQGMQSSPSRRQVVPNKPLPAPPPRVAALSGRDAVLGNGLSGQRGTKAQSVDADSTSLLSARNEAMSLHVHQRVSSDRSPRNFIPAPVRSDSSPDLRGPRGGSHRTGARSPHPELTPEGQEEELIEELLLALQDEESLTLIEARVRDAAMRQGHYGRLRSDNDAIRFDKVRTNVF